jgi:hypothetical protein
MKVTEEEINSPYTHAQFLYAGITDAEYDYINFAKKLMLSYNTQETGEQQ